MSPETLRTLMAHATPPRSGDFLAGLACESQEARVKAQRRLADTGLAEFLETPLVDPETDEVSRLILDRHDAVAFAPVAGLSVGGFRDWLLSEAATPETLSALKWGLTPEMVAAV